MRKRVSSIGTHRASSRRLLMFRSFFLTRGDHLEEQEHGVTGNEEHVEAGAICEEALSALGVVEVESLFLAKVYVDARAVQLGEVLGGLKEEPMAGGLGERVPSMF